jgi:hypothetical protein
MPRRKKPARVSSVKVLERAVFCWAKTGVLSTMIRRRYRMIAGREGGNGREYIGLRTMGRDGMEKMMEGGGRSGLRQPKVRGARRLEG